MSKDATIVKDGLGQLLQQFSGAANLRAWLESYLQSCQDFEDAIYPMLTERDLDLATGHRLDGFGQLVNIPRGGMVDADYRVRIKTELAVLTSNGNYESMFALLELLYDNTQTFEVVEYFPKSVVFRAVDVITSLDDGAFSGTQLQRAAPAGTFVQFVYSTEVDGDTFTLSSQAATVETSSLLGLSDLNIGGGWRYEVQTNTIGMSNGSLRFNTTDPADATTISIQDVDASVVDRDAFLDALTGDQIVITTPAAAMVAHVTNSIDYGVGHSLSIEDVVTVGSWVDDAIASVDSNTDGGALSGAAPE